MQKQTKNDEEMIVLISDVNNEGIGITKQNNYVGFIKNTLVGEKVLINNIVFKKKYFIASPKQIIEKSKERIKVKCSNYDKCGGCSFLHTSINEENRYKENYIKNLFKGIMVEKIISDEKEEYRNKINIHVNNKKIGFYKEKSNDLVPINDCLLVDSNIKKVISLLDKIKLDNIKEIVIRKSFNDNKIMIIFDNIISNDDIKLLSRDISSIYVGNKKIYGDDYLIEKVGNYYFSIYPSSFFQVNTNMIKRLYDVIKTYAGYGEKLLDLYCGTGTIGIYLANNFNYVLGVEKNKYAIYNANINKDLNNVKNIEFSNCDASLINNDYYDVIVVDPPRKGLSKDVINNIEKLKPLKIIYTSCNPNTLKRDVELLKGYKLEKITPVNSFLRTKHIECVALLERE